MNAIHPTIAAAIRPWTGWTNDPVADAADHFNRLADTFTTDVTYLGIDFCVEVNRHSLNVVDLIGPGGEDWFYELSGDAKRNIARLALKGSGI